MQEQSSNPTWDGHSLLSMQFALRPIKRLQTSRVENTYYQGVEAYYLSSRPGKSKLTIVARVPLNQNKMIGFFFPSPSNLRPIVWLYFLIWINRLWDFYGPFWLWPTCTSPVERQKEEKEKTTFEGSWDQKGSCRVQAGAVGYLGWSECRYPFPKTARHRCMSTFSLQVETLSVIAVP